MRLLLVILAFGAMSCAFGFAPMTRPALARPAFTVLSMVADEIEEVYMDMEDRMEKSVESVKKNLMTIRTGRANPNMLDRVKCDYYGVETPLNQMATISVPSAQQLQISPLTSLNFQRLKRPLPKLTWA